MIAFDLICAKGHIFECWFKNSASFEEQKEAGIINCPICNDTQVGKILSPFSVKKDGGGKKAEVDPNQVLQSIQDFVDKHFEDVGVDFTKEALKIHYGESKKRNIKGTATSDEETLLKKEGVQFLKIPIVKRLLN
ncbi:MAG TPA: DUF1178 family protein [Thermodesulfobacteriota bacterium]|nr:DUF1178 family protein [Thermodesulfobacteriota bacterium]